MNKSQVQFTLGEVTPKLDPHKVNGGCKHLENFIPKVEGPVERRPGTKLIYNASTVGNPYYNEIVNPGQQTVYTKFFIGFFNTNNYLCVAKVNTDSTLDTDWGTNGYWGYTGANGGTLVCYDILQLSDGRMLVAHNSFWVDAASYALGGKLVCASMISADGTLDTTWGYNGFYVISYGPDSYDYPMVAALNIFELNDGNFVICGSANDGSVYNYHRFDSDGTFIATKAWNQAPTLSANNFDACWSDSSHTTILLSDYGYILAIDPDTFLKDSTWGTSGLYIASEANPCYCRNIIDVDDGFVIIYDHASQTYSSLKITSDGTALDTTWGTSGYNDVGYTIEHKAVGGYSGTWNGTYLYTLCSNLAQTTQYLYKWDSDGSLVDSTSFTSGGTQEVYHFISSVNDDLYLGTKDVAPATDDVEKWTSNLTYESSFDTPATIFRKNVIIPDETTVTYI